MVAQYKDSNKSDILRGEPVVRSANDAVLEAAEANKEKEALQGLLAGASSINLGHLPSDMAQQLHRAIAAAQAAIQSGNIGQLQSARAQLDSAAAQASMRDQEENDKECRSLLQRGGQAILRLAGGAVGINPSHQAIPHFTHITRQCSQQFPVEHVNRSELCATTSSGLDAAGAPSKAPSKHMPAPRMS